MRSNVDRCLPGSRSKTNGIVKEHGNAQNEREQFVAPQFTSFQIEIGKWFDRVCGRIEVAENKITAAKAKSAIATETYTIATTTTAFTVGDWRSTVTSLNSTSSAVGIDSSKCQHSNTTNRYQTKIHDWGQWRWQRVRDESIVKRRFGGNRDSVRIVKSRTQWSHCEVVRIAGRLESRPE